MNVAVAAEAERSLIRPLAACWKAVIDPARNGRNGAHQLMPCSSTPLEDTTTPTSTTATPSTRWRLRDFRPPGGREVLSTTSAPAS